MGKELYSEKILNDSLKETENPMGFVSLKNKKGLNSCRRKSSLRSLGKS